MSHFPHSYFKCFEVLKVSEVKSIICFTPISTPINNTIGRKYEDGENLLLRYFHLRNVFQLFPPENPQEEHQVVSFLAKQFQMSCPTKVLKVSEIKDVICFTPI